MEGFLFGRETKGGVLVVFYVFFSTRKDELEQRRAAFLAIFDPSQRAMINPKHPAENSL
jgi:hypothetical protein